MKRLMVVCLAVAVALMLAGGAGAAATPGRGNSGAAHACNDGGYLTLERMDGTAFVNTGACVSYAARGSRLQNQPTITLSNISISACNNLTVGYELGGVGHDLYSKALGCFLQMFDDVTIGPFPSATLFRIYLRDDRCGGVTFYDDGGHAQVTGSNPYLVDITDAGFDCEFTNVDRAPIGRGNLRLTKLISR